MQTLCKHYYKPRKSAVDISVSINVMSRNCEGFPAFASQTPINGFKYLAVDGKQNGQEMTRQRHPALPTAKGPRMAVDSYDEANDLYKSDILYFITDGTFIKIGRSNDTDKRLFMLQTGNPQRLRTWAVLPSMGWQESLWHFAFSKYRKRGEWFYHRHQIDMAIEAAQSGKEWISILRAEAATKDHEAHMPDTDADFAWRDEVADYEELLTEKSFWRTKQCERP